ncbi:hypothetical protein [Arthrobacter castelli]|uniref:hypothetical protein n=1 Tax=Arthrobacter castelli TaxID=271431 RepID=UPI0004182453|nr:hypothetical protein [Arthrobacter castelli]
MTKRLIWVGIGVTIGIIAVRKASEAKAKYGPEGINRAMGSLADSVSGFAETMRQGMSEREADLRIALGIDTEQRTGSSQ